MQNINTATNDISLTLIFFETISFSITICVIARKIRGKTLDNWLHFYLSEPRVLAEAAGCKSYFALTLISQIRHFHMWRDMLMKYSSLKYYALINRARGPYEEIFVLTFKAYGPNAVRSMRLECQNKYFPYGPKSQLIRALLCTYPNKTV